MLWTYANKFNNLYKISKFVERHKLLKPTQEEKEKMNKPITSKEIKLVIKKLSTKKSPGLHW